MSSRHDLTWSVEGGPSSHFSNCLSEDMVRGLDFCGGEATPGEWKKKNVPKTSVISLSRRLLWLAHFSDSHKVCYEEKRKTSRTVLLYLLLLQRDSVDCLVPGPNGMLSFYLYPARRTTV